MGPFDFVSGLFRSDQDPDSANPTGPAQPPLGQADPSYRTNVFEPQGGSGDFNPFALAGRMMGMPTTSERQGMVNQMAQRELAERMERGMPADKAIMDFIQSPKGQNWMGSGVADVQGVLKNFVDNVQPRQPIQGPALSPGSSAQRTAVDGPNRGQTENYTAPETSQVVPPEHSVIGGAKGNPPVQAAAAGKTLSPGQVHVPGNRQDVPSANPTAEVQNFERMTELAKLTEADLRELAQMHAMTPEGRMARPIQMSLQRLVQSEQITPRQRDMFLSGAIKIQEGSNRFGQKNGQFYTINTMNGEITEVGAPNAAYSGSNPLNPGTPGRGQGETLAPAQRPPQPGQQRQGSTEPTQQQPYVGLPPATQSVDTAARAAPASGVPSDIPTEAYKPDGSVDWSKTGPRANMWLGVGAKALLTDVQTRVMSFMLGQVPEGSQGGRIVQDARAQFRNFQNGLSGLAQTGNNLGIPSDLVAQVKSLAEGGGWTDDPGAAARQGKVLADRLINEIKITNGSLANDNNASEEMLKVWERRIDTYKNVLRQMPSPEDMEAFAKQYDQGKVSMSAAEAAKGTFRASTDLVNDFKSGGTMSEVAHGYADRVVAAKTAQELNALRKEMNKLPETEQSQLNKLVVNRARELIGGADQTNKTDSTPRGRPESQKKDDNQRTGVNRNQKADSGKSNAQQVRDRFPTEDEQRDATTPRPGVGGPSATESRAPAPAAAVKTVTYRDGKPQETTAPAPQPVQPTPPVPVHQPSPVEQVHSRWGDFPTTGGGGDVPNLMEYAPQQRSGGAADFLKNPGIEKVTIHFGKASGGSQRKPTPFARVQ